MDTKIITRQYRLQKWAKIIAERNASGLTIQAFCLERGIARHAYFYWLKRVRLAASQTLQTAPNTRFAPLEISPAPVSSLNVEKLTIHYGKLALDVYEYTPPQLLKNTLAVLLRELPSC